MYCRLYSVQEDTEADNGLFPIIKKQTANHRIRRTNVAGYVSLCTCTQQCHAWQKGTVKQKIQKRMATVAALNEHRVNIQRTLALPAHAPLDFQQHFHRTVIFQQLPKHKRAYVNLACNCVRFGAIQSMMVISYVKYLPRLAYHSY